MSLDNAWWVLIVGALILLATNVGSIWINGFFNKGRILSFGEFKDRIFWSTLMVWAVVGIPVGVYLSFLKIFPEVVSMFFILIMCLEILLLNKAYDFYTKTMKKIG